MRGLVAAVILGASLSWISAATAGEHELVRTSDLARAACATPGASWQRLDFDDRGWGLRLMTVRDPNVKPPGASASPSPGGATNANGNSSASPAPGVGSANASGSGSTNTGASGTGNWNANAGSDDDEPSPVDTRPPRPSAPPPDCLGARFARWHFTVADLPNLQTLTLRIRYAHGFAAYLNGVELGRRRLDANTPPDGLASDVHGPEAERVIVQVHNNMLRRGDNVLAVEAHPRTAQREAQMEVALFADDAPRIVRGPYLLSARATGITVVFDTDLPTVGELRIGLTDAYGTLRGDRLGTHHVLTVDGLRPGTLYHYRVLGRAGSAPGESAGRAAAADSGSSIVQTSRDGRGDSSSSRATASRAGDDSTSSRPTASRAGDDSTSSRPTASRAGDDSTSSRPTASRAGDDSASSRPTASRAGDDSTSAVAADLQTADSGDAIFHTLPDAGRPLRFAVYGDVRSGHDIHAALNRALADDDPDFAILTGDLVDRGSDEGDWERFFEVAGSLLRQLPIFPAIGNHEYARQGHGALTFMQLFRFPVAAEAEPAWYSFDVGSAHFVALDSNQYKTSRQLSWLEHDLKEARRRGVRAIFVYAHEGPYSSGMHGDNSVCIRDYVPLFERYRISMMFTGHDHDFERGRVNTLDYLVTGGGGAELRATRCGVPGKKACPPRVLGFVNDHNYVMVELLPSLFRVCPKHVDGTPLEPCTVYPLRQP